jgi:hypothetical protein
VAGRLLVLCSKCDKRPDAAVRLGELIGVDWQASPQLIS